MSKPTTEFLIKLNKVLPNGKARLLRERIINKHGKTFKVYHVSRVLCPNHRAHDDMIVDEALRWAEEIYMEKIQKERLLDEIYNHSYKTE